MWWPKTYWLILVIFDFRSMKLSKQDAILRIQVIYHRNIIQDQELNDHQWHICFLQNNTNSQWQIFITDGPSLARNDVLWAVVYGFKVYLTFCSGDVRAVLYRTSIVACPAGSLVEGQEITWPPGWGFTTKFTSIRILNQFNILSLPDGENSY